MDTPRHDAHWVPHSFWVAECLVTAFLLWAGCNIASATIRLLVANTFLWVAYRIAVYPLFVNPLRKLPMPTGGYPFIGHTLSQFTFPRGDNYLSYAKLVPNNGLIHLRGIFNSSHLLLTSLEALKEVLVTKPYEFEKPHGERSFLRSVLGDGLVVVEGDVHKHQRKLMLPTFSHRQIKTLYSIFWEKSLSLINAIENHAISGSSATDRTGFKSGAVDIDCWAPKATLDIIGLAALGRDFKSLENSDDALARAYQALTEPTTANLVDLAIHAYAPRWFSRIFSVMTTRNSISKELHSHCRQFLREKKTTSSKDGSDHVDILSQLLISGEFTDTQLVDQLLTFIAAGHETTSSTLSWVVYLLSIHPDVQAQLRNEIDIHVPYLNTLAGGAEIARVLEALPVLHSVCNETLRLFPTVPVSYRVPKCDTTILGYPVCKGTRLIISPWVINRSPQHWGEDADKFVPRRWIEPMTGRPNNSGGARNNFSLLTFLHGPRSCIGQGFAKAELKCLVAAFVGAFEIGSLCSPDSVVPGGTVTTKPVGGMRVTVKVRPKLQRPSEE